MLCEKDLLNLLIDHSERHVQNILTWQILPRLRDFLTEVCPENLIVRFINV